MANRARFTNALSCGFLSQAFESAPGVKLVGSVSAFSRGRRGLLAAAQILHPITDIRSVVAERSGHSLELMTGQDHALATVAKRQL